MFLIFQLKPFQWDPESEVCLSTFSGHSQLVYTATFSPHSPATFASVSGDGHLKLWTCTESSRPAAVIKAHDAEVITNYLIYLIVLRNVLYVC